MKGTQSLERALDILFVIGESGGTLSVPEIARRVSIPESSAYRFLQTLERNGIVERKGQGQIGLGLRIMDLAKSLNNQMEQQLSIIAKPFMEQLMEETKETNELCVRTGINAIVIQSVPGSYLVRFVGEKGKTFPLHSGASGKAILAFENEKVIHQVDASCDGGDSLQQDLNWIRKKGYSLTQSEVDTGIIGIAAPIFDSRNRVAASVAIIGPESRIDDELTKQFTEKVIQTAEQITESLKFVSELKLV